MTVELDGAFAVHFDHGAIEFEAGKYAAGSGVAEHLGAHLPVSIGGGMTANRTSSNGRVGAQLEFAVQQVLHTLVVHDEHDQVNCLASDLQPEAAALNGKERRVAPSFGGAATGDAAAILRAEHKSCLQHRGNHRDALGRSHDFVRDAGIGRSLDLLQHGGGGFDAIGGLVVLIAAER